MNVVALTGRLVKDPVRITSTNGTEIAKFTVAVPRTFKNKEGKDADFIDVTAFDTLAKTINGYMQKGKKVNVVGEINNNNYIKKDGTKQYTYDIIARTVEFAESKSEEAEWFIEANNKYYAE